MTLMSRVLADEKAAEDRAEQARLAIKNFRAMMPGLNAYARALTGRQSLRIEVSKETAAGTDGNKIYIRPPMALGDRTQHTKNLCDKRDDHGMQRCAACRIREEVLVLIYHEVAHIAFDSFAPVSEQDRTELTRRAALELGTKYSKGIVDRLDAMPERYRRSYQTVAGMLNEFLPMILNALEDARVNAAMFKARRGTRKMFEASSKQTFTRGVQQPDNSVMMWNQYPLNMQAIIGLYVKASGYDYGTWLHEKVVADLDDETLAEICEEVITTNHPGQVYNLSFRALARLRELGYCKSDRDPEDEEEEEADAPPESGEPDENEAEPEAEPDEADSGESEPADEDAGDDPDDGQGDQGSEEAASGDEPAGDPEAESDSEPDESGDPSDGDQGDEGEGEVGDGEAQGDGDSDSEDGAGGGEADPDGDEGADPAEDAGGSEVGDDPDAAPADGEDDAEPSDGDGAESDDAGSGDTEASDDSDDAGGGDSDGDGEAGSDGGGQGAAAEPSDEGNGGTSGVPGEDDSDEDDASDAGSGTDGETESGDAGESDGDGPGEEELSDDGSGEGSGDAEPTDSEGAEPTHADDRLSDEGDQPVGDGTPGEEAESQVDRDADGDDALGDDRGESDDVGGEDDGEPLPAQEGDGIEAEPLPEYGDASDIADQVAEALGHDRSTGDVAVPDEIIEDAAAEQAVKQAIIQGDYFETPSSIIAGVREHRFGDDSTKPTPDCANGWSGHSIYERLGYTKRELGREGDFTPAEAILGPALMRMRVAFSENKRGRTQAHLKSGKINGRSLGKRAWGDDERLFKKKTVPGKRSYFVLIGIDVSGSTAGENIVLAKEAAWAQAELCHRMGVQFAVYAHSGNRDTPGGLVSMDIYHIKDPDEPWNDRCKEALQGIGPDAANLDGHTIEYYRKILDKVTATDKIIMYYTDGKMPAENHDEELEILLREIQVCRQKGYTLMAVGVRTDSPTEHDLDTARVDEHADIIGVVRHLERRLEGGVR